MAHARADGEDGLNDKSPMASRFRGFLPVVIDVECGGFNPNTDALLEIAAVLIEIQGDGSLLPGEGWRYHVQPFPGANLEPASLAVTGIDPFHPLRPAISEKDALTRLFDARVRIRLIRWFRTEETAFGAASPPAQSSEGGGAP